MSMIIALIDAADVQYQQLHLCKGLKQKRFTIYIFYAMLVTDWLTDWLTDSRLAKLIDVTLACEDAYSKLVEVVFVADVDDENRVENSLM